LNFCTVAVEKIMKMMMKITDIVNTNSHCNVIGFYLQNWKVFVKVPELIILVPPLLGLKGNLEMTLASRLSTQVTFTEYSAYMHTHSHFIAVFLKSVVFFKTWYILKLFSPFASFMLHR